MFAPAIRCVACEEVESIKGTKGETAPALFSLKVPCASLCLSLSLSPVFSFPKVEKEKDEKIKRLRIEY